MHLPEIPAQYNPIELERMMVKEQNKGYMEEVDAKLPNIRWRIDFDRADGVDLSSLRLLDIDSNNTLLEVDLNKIPEGMNVTEFIEMLQKTGIACIDSFKKHQKGNK